MHRLVMAALLLTMLTATACIAGGDSSAALERKKGQPEVVQHYSCDGSPQYTLGKKHFVKDGGQMTFRITGYGMVYFTIETEYTDRQPGKPGGNPRHSVMHYVLGTYESGQGATARVKGRFEMNDADAALVQLDRGWLWVSDKPPPNWPTNSLNAQAAASVEFTDAGTPTRSLGTPALSWSIYTVLRNEFSWAGATATTFLYRNENVSSGSRSAGVLYNREQGSTTRHSYSENGSRTYKEYKYGRQLRVLRQAGAKPVKETASVSADAAFVKYAENRVGLLEKHPSVGAPDCRTHHEKAK